jgi:hypothetical protein
MSQIPKAHIFTQNATVPLGRVTILSPSDSAAGEADTTFTSILHSLSARSTALQRDGIIPINDRFEIESHSRLSVG